MKKIIDYIESIFNCYPNLSVYLACFAVAGFIFSCLISYYIDNSLIFGIGITFSGFLALMPLWILINFFLLLFFPGIFKEYSMKQRRKKEGRFNKKQGQNRETDEDFLDEKENYEN